MVFSYFWVIKNGKQIPKLKPPQNNIILGGAYVLLFIGLVIFVPERAHGGDIGHWERWAQFIQAEGLANIYNYGLGVETLFPCNYPPLILYFFGTFSWIFSDAEAITQHAKYLKIIPLIFDFVGAMLIFLLLRPMHRYWWVPLLLLLNPAYLYNSYLWGQLDSIFTALIVAALILAGRRSVYWATILFALALHTKLQSVVFIPVFILAIFPAIRSWRTLINIIILGAASLILPLLPFLLGNTIDQWYTVMTGLVDQYRNVSLNAFNFWQFFHEGQGALYAKDYQPFWFGIDYKTWGLSLFFIFSFIALLPLLLYSIKNRIQSHYEKDTFIALVLLSAILCVLGFFFFNTQMHERYAHPAMLLAFLYGLLCRDYLLFVLITFAYFLNLEAVLKFFSWNYDIFLFHQDFIATLFLSALLYGTYKLYKAFHPLTTYRYLSQHYPLMTNDR